MQLDGIIFTNSSAALGIVIRTGLERMKHLHTQPLWVQGGSEVNTLGVSEGQRRA